MRYDLNSRFNPGEKIYPLCVDLRENRVPWHVGNPFEVRAIEFMLPPGRGVEIELTYRPYNRDYFISDQNAFATKESAQKECDRRNEEIHDKRCEFAEHQRNIATRYNFISSEISSYEGF